MYTFVPPYASTLPSLETDSAYAIPNELWTFFCSYSKFLFGPGCWNYLLLALTCVSLSPCLKTDIHCRTTLALLSLFKQWVPGCYLLSSFHQIPSLSTIRLCYSWSVEMTMFMELRGPLLWNFDNSFSPSVYPDHWCLVWFLFYFCSYCMKSLLWSLLDLSYIFDLYSSAVEY